MIYHLEFENEEVTAFACITDYGYFMLPTVNEIFVKVNELTAISLKGRYLKSIDPNQVVTSFNVLL